MTFKKTYLMNLIVAVGIAGLSIFFFINAYDLFNFFENLISVIWKIIIISVPLLTAYVLKNNNKPQLSLFALILNITLLVIIVLFIIISAYKQNFSYLGVALAIVVFSLPLLINIRALHKRRN